MEKNSVGTSTASKYAWQMPSLGVLCLAAALSGAEPQGQSHAKGSEKTAAALADMNPVQREHARLHSGKGQPGQKLLDEGLSVTVFSQPGGVAEPESLQTLFERQACRADVVVVGSITKAEAFPSEDGSMLFTDHHVIVSEVIRNRRPEALPRVILVTRIGGSLKVDKRQITADVRGFPPLSTGELHLFFLQFLPKYETFHAADDRSAWRVGAGFVRNVNHERRNEPSGAFGDAPFARVRTWIQESSCR